MNSEKTLTYPTILQSYIIIQVVKINELWTSFLIRQSSL